MGQRSSGCNLSLERGAGEQPSKHYTFQVFVPSSFSIVSVCCLNLLILQVDAPQGTEQAVSCVSV